MTQRLIGLAKAHWAFFDGMLASQGVDPMRARPDRFLNLVYWYATRNASDKESSDKFDRMLWMPPKGVAPAAGSPWSPESETAAFAAFAAQVGVAVPKGTKSGA